MRNTAEDEPHRFFLTIFRLILQSEGPFILNLRIPLEEFDPMVRNRGNGVNTLFSNDSVQ
jgi:hypothetical protein